MNQTATTREEPREDWPQDAAQALIADIPTPALPCWSRSGTHLAWLWDAGAGWELWVSDLGGEPRRVTTGAALAQPCWLADDRSLLFTQRMDGGTRLAIADIVSGQTRVLTSGPHDRSGQVSPDGTQVAFVSGRAGALDIWRIATEGGAATQLTEQTNPLDEPRWTPRWSPDGAWIAYISSRSGERNNDDLWVVSVDGSRHRQLSTGLLVDTDAAWSPDGQTLAVVAVTATEHWYGDDGDVWLVGLDDLQARRLTAAGGATRRGEGQGIGWLPDGNALYVLRHQNGDTNLCCLRLSDGVPSPMTNLRGVISDVALEPGGGTFALVMATQTSPPAVALLTADGGLPTPITPASNLSVPLIEPIRMPYLADNGLYCDGYLYLPPGFTGGTRYPALVQVHGGGTNSFGNGWHPIEQFLAQRGFVIFAVEYRGSSGYGRSYADLSWGDWGGGHVRDAIAAGAFLRSKPWVGGVGIYGQSFGGYISLHSIVQAPDAFQAAADMYGITNRFDYFDRSDRVGRLFVSRDYGGRRPQDAPEHYLQASTHHRLHEIRTPLLVLHGSEDKRVPPVQSEAVVAELQRHNVAHEYVVYPGEGHGFRKRSHRIDAYERLARWFGMHLRADV